MKHMSVRRKIQALIATAVVAMLLIAGAGLYFLNQMSNASRAMYQENLLPIQEVAQIRIDTRALDSFLVEMMLTKDETRVTELQADIDTRQEQIRASVTKIEKTGQFDAKEKKQLEELKDNVLAYDNSMTIVQDAATRNETEEAYTAYTQGLEQVRDNVANSAKSLMASMTKQAKTLDAQNQAEKQTAFYLMLGTFLLAVLLFAGLAMYITRLITRPIRQLQGWMDQSGNGDLTVRGTYDSKDELGQLTTSFNEMIASQQQVVLELTGTADRVAVASDELSVNAESTTKATEMVAVTMEEMASGASQQLHQVSDASRTIEELTTSVRYVAGNAQQMTERTADAMEKVALGGQVVGTLGTQMGRIQEDVSRLSHVIDGLGNRSQEIGQITDSIKGVAAQTNLLALNAAIEAARAGEQGRGFAVVAAEVKTLAEQSAVSAKQIESLIRVIQQETEASVASMEKVSTEMTSGIAVVDQAGASFSEIETAITDVTGHVEEVSGAVQEMAAASEQIASVMRTIQAVTEGTAAGTQNISASTEEQMASMEEITSASQSLATMADDLKQVTGRFTV
ncbi:chemotaxis protein [Exiguobacterium sp. U13-1]|uniref:Methyl-accepting chemotaxis protein n=1 Tax=Exiguobacterium acetylicum TaxID=41170 RepID=A0ABX8GEQ8_EXIAC|nr:MULTISPECIES: methyl-accepting chemotaxis protein [Exiguobacterium]AOT00632.1 chemotaxis protein [Exiguobacterium sp. U13-1]QWB31597.1 methyl-accepting chemotaxis protein [Exiguobacterium acetylicum]